jgi:pimeloyl-ACP methyl ester carboxylesterase
VTVQTLPTGAQIRFTGRTDGIVALCVNGGTARELPGTWSPSAELLMRRCTPHLPDVGWAEVRYRVHSWRQLEMCIEDGRAALDAAAAAGAREVVLVGYSMGGGVSTAISDHPLVRQVIGLAPWLPERLDLSGMCDREIAIVHGALDRHLPGIPGVSPESSRRGFERLLAVGARGTYTMIPGAIPPIALRAPWGSLIPMPRAEEWARRVRSVVAAAARREPAPGHAS